MRSQALALFILFQSAAAFAQSPPAILPSGDAAVAGFSGTYVLDSPPEAQRVDKTYISIDGPSLRVIDLTRMGGPPQGQLVEAAKPFTVTAGQIGQVFALALDDATPPNIYAAATSAYGLPIVVPDTDGDGRPDRSRRGAPNAAFMPGLFGPVTANGGPGSIWKIDGQSGAVTLFANVALGGVPNSGPALGGLAFDRASRQIFVADRDTGMIHRFTLDGVDRGHFDHGAQALAAAGLPPIAFDPRKRLNIESPAFDSGNPETWAYAPPARRVFALAIGGGRLYYAVAAGLRIWSVALLPDGSFGADARFEVAIPRTAPAAAEISEILFDDNGDMLVAERGAPTGAFDYAALAQAGENRVLRFRPKLPDDPPSRDLWFPVPKEYAIGFPPNYRNDNGGIAIGYGYDAGGNINRAACGGTLWSTGEQLRNASDPAIVRRLQPGGPPIVNGLQGNAMQLLRPLNEPPFETYFVDYDDRFDDPPARGHLGDVVIWRVCGQAAAVPLLPPPIVCPVGLFDVDGVCLFGLACPAGTEFSGGCCVYRDCPASYVRIHGRCVPPPVNCNSDETYSSEGRCEAPKCPAGLVPAERKAGRSMPKACGSYCTCPKGTRLSEDGTCRPSSGCGPHMVVSHNECICEDGYLKPPGSSTCVPVSQCDPSSGVTAGCCPQGKHFNLATTTCEPDSQHPTLKIFKSIDPGSCGTSGGQTQCVFTITVTNQGPGLYTGPISITESGGSNAIRLDPVGLLGPWNCTPTGQTVSCSLPAGATLGAGASVQASFNATYPAGAHFTNCAALGPVAPGTNATPSGDFSCVQGTIPNGQTCPAGTSVVNGTCFGSTAACPNGAPRNSDGNCPTPPTYCPDGKIAINGLCRTSPPPQLGCPPGTVPTNDGTSCSPSSGGTPQVCQRPKIMSDGACVCPAGTVGNDCHKPEQCDSDEFLNDAGKCVERRRPHKEKPPREPKRQKPSPPSEGSSKPPPVELDIGIGIGIGGHGGHPGGGPPRMPTGRRGGG